MRWLFLVVLIFCGCAKYNTPEFEVIEPYETGFLLPLEGDTGKQQAFASEKFLQERKVAAKRVQITKRWVSTGRMWWSGEWIPDVRLVKVDRKTVTREWTASAKTGTAAKDQAIQVESRDSVNFGIGFTVTAHIPEDKAALFLYRYPSKSLDSVLDTECRARVTSCLSTVASKYDLQEVRSKKSEMLDLVKKDVLPFFQERGIEVSTVAIVGGFTFSNPAIQHAIDKTIQDQQLKVSSQARLEAQEVDSKTIKLSAQAKAEAARQVAKGEADAIKTVAEAKAFEIEKAVIKDKDIYIELKRIEVEQERLKKWNGQYPHYFMGGAANTPNLFMPLPTPEKKK